LPAVAARTAAGKLKTPRSTPIPAAISVTSLGTGTQALSGTISRRIAGRLSSFTSLNS
jgi:hypothetical protein